MCSASPTPPAAPAVGAAPAPVLGAVARRLLDVCRAHHGRAVGLSFLALRSGLGMERCHEELHELNAAGLVCYTCAASPLWAPPAPWHPSCCYAGNNGWGIVCEMPEAGQPHRYQQRRAPGAYASEQQAQAAADQFNHAAPVIRYRPADLYAMREVPEDYTPHPWELK